MGAEGRLQVERHHTWEAFVHSVRCVVEEVADDYLLPASRIVRTEKLRAPVMAAAGAVNHQKES
jgi:hypothetical protein